MDNTLLRTALRGNAIFSASSSAVMLAFADQLSTTFSVPPAALLVLGIGLLPWAAFAWLISRSPSRTPVLLIIAGDFLWVIGTAVLIMGFPGAMDVAGRVAFAAIAVVVAAFGVTQIVGLRQAGGLRPVYER